MSFSGLQFTGHLKHPSIPVRYGSMLSASSASVQVVSWLFFVPIAPSTREGRYRKGVPVVFSAFFTTLVRSVILATAWL